jgi:phage tail sheath protein FI
MPQYLAPGVYVEEISTGPKPIEGVSTSVAGFVGPTERGPESITSVSSWIEFQRVYGGHLDPALSFMTYAVKGFFDNQGQRCYVGRVVAKAGANVNSGTVGNLVLQAVGRGSWGNRIYVRVLQASQAARATDPNDKAKNWFRLQLLYYGTQPAKPYDPTVAANRLQKDYVAPDVFEDYDNLTEVRGASNNVLATVNGASNLVVLKWNGNPTPVPVSPATADFVQLGTAGADGKTIDQLTIDDYDGTPTTIGNPPDELLGQGAGFQGMATVKDVSLLLAPDHVTVDQLLERVVQDCEQNRDRFGVLSVGRAFRPQDKPGSDTNFAAQYYPWIRIYDAASRDYILVPPAGHMAGIIAQTDINQGVHKAPANVVVAGATDLQKPVTKADQEQLNPVGINCIRDFRPDGRGIRLWGARTMTSDPEWKYVNVRRLFIYVEQSIDRGTQWVVFEPNSDPTWARVVRTITAFLVTVWRNGALMGTTQDQAFFVKCDRTTMTQDDIDNGRLICYIGIAPVKPAEFVIFRIGQKTADAQS